MWPSARHIGRRFQRRDQTAFIGDASTGDFERRAVIRGRPDKWQSEGYVDAVKEIQRF